MRVNPMGLVYADARQSPGEGLIMMQQTMDEHEAKRGYCDIVAADEVHRSLWRQIATSAGGLLALLGIGLVVLVVVLWKAR